METIDDIITKAKVEMLIHFPFYATLLHHLELEKRDDIGTMGVTSTTMYYNEDFVRNLPNGERIFLMAHEVLHLALGHLWRRGSRQPMLWNCACDYVINEMLMEHIEENDLRRMIPISGGRFEPKYRKMSSEQVYDLLLTNMTDGDSTTGPHGSGKGDTGGLLDNHDIWDEVKESEKSMSEDIWKSRTINAAKVAGDAPAGVKRLIDDILSPKKDWRELINESIATTYNDYSFTPPDRRFSDIILPDFNEPENHANDILIWIDTSGSVSKKELTTFLSEIVGAIDQFGGNMNGWIGTFDYICHDPIEFSTVEDCLALPLKGGGGTSFINVFKKTTKLQRTMNISTMVIFTDGYATFPDKNPFDFDVIWIMTSDVVPPVGRYAKLAE